MNEPDQDQGWQVGWNEPNGSGHCSTWAGTLDKAEQIAVNIASYKGTKSVKIYKNVFLGKRGQHE